MARAKAELWSTIVTFLLRAKRVYNLIGAKAIGAPFQPRVTEIPCSIRQTSPTFRISPKYRGTVEFFNILTAVLVLLASCSAVLLPTDAHS